MTMHVMRKRKDSELYAKTPDQLPLVCTELYKVKVNSQGYDASGGYWGAGAPVWLFRLFYAEQKLTLPLKHKNNRRVWVASTREYYGECSIRAKNKTEAKNKIRSTYNVKRFV